MKEPSKGSEKRPGSIRDLIRDLVKEEAPDGGFVIVKGTAVGPTEPGHIGYYMDEVGPWPPMIDPAKDIPKVTAHVTSCSFAEFQNGILKEISLAYQVPEELLKAPIHPEKPLLCETYKKNKKCLSRIKTFKNHLSVVSLFTWLTKRI